MPSTGPRYSKEEFARRGDEMYERNIRALVEPLHDGEFVAIDIDSGAYEVDEDDFTATERLLARRPEAQIWLVRAGHRAAYRIGRQRAVVKQ